MEEKIPYDSEFNQFLHHVDMGRLFMQDIVQDKNRKRPREPVRIQLERRLGTSWNGIDDILLQAEQSDSAYNVVQTEVGNSIRRLYNEEPQGTIKDQWMQLTENPQNPKLLGTDILRRPEGFTIDTRYMSIPEKLNYHFQNLMTYTNQLDPSLVSFQNSMSNSLETKLESVDQSNMREGRVALLQEFFYNPDYQRYVKLQTLPPAFLSWVEQVISKGELRTQYQNELSETFNLADPKLRSHFLADVNRISRDQLRGGRSTTMKRWTKAAVGKYGLASLAALFAIYYGKQSYDSGYLQGLLQGGQSGSSKSVSEALELEGLIQESVAYWKSHLSDFTPQVPNLPVEEVNFNTKPLNPAYNYRTHANPTHVLSHLSYNYAGPTWQRNLARQKKLEEKEIELLVEITKSAALEISKLVAQTGAIAEGVPIVMNTANGALSKKFADEAARTSKTILKYLNDPNYDVAEYEEYILNQHLADRLIEWELQAIAPTHTGLSNAKQNLNYFRDNIVHSVEHLNYLDTQAKDILETYKLRNETLFKGVVDYAYNTAKQNEVNYLQAAAVIRELREYPVNQRNDAFTVAHVFGLLPPEWQNLKGQTHAREISVKDRHLKELLTKQGSIFQSITDFFYGKPDVIKEMQKEITQHFVQDYPEFGAYVSQIFLGNPLLLRQFEQDMRSSYQEFVNARTTKEVEDAFGLWIRKLDKSLELAYANAILYADAYARKNQFYGDRANQIVYDTFRVQDETGGLPVDID